jgi:cold shock CspA family protein
VTVGVGRVVAFDPHGGYGAVVGEDGAEHVFHLTAIAGGTRTIEVGTVVAYELVAGHLGRWEATGLHPLPA